MGPSTLSAIPSVRGGGFVVHDHHLLASSIVIVGALFKILHWPGANIMLIVGLLKYHVKLNSLSCFVELEVVLRLGILCQLLLS